MILPDLPASDDKFWEHAKKIKMNKSKAKKCSHEFKRMSGSEICCILCNIGFIANGYLKIKNGKLVV